MRIEKLILNGQEATLNNSTKIILNRDFVDLQNPDAKIGDGSFNIKLPKDKNNSIILEHIEIENLQDKFVRTQEINAVYYVDGRIVHNGIFRITSIDNNYYNGILLGGEVAWSKLLNGKVLSDLKNDDLITPWSTTFYGFSGSSTPYSQAWYIDNVDYNTQDICFPLISYGNFFTSSIINSSNGIYLDSLAGDDIPPSVYDLKIIKRIFQNIGWNVNSSIFSSVEHQNVFTPFTSSDRYTWNYGQIMDASASGGTINIPQVYSANTQADYSQRINFVGSGTNLKYCDFSILDFPVIINNPAGNIVTQTFTGQNGSFTSQQYNTPITDIYSFDIEINNWSFKNRGLYRSDFITQFASYLNPITPDSLYFLRDGFIIYLDDQDGNYTNQVLNNCTQYCWEFYDNLGVTLDNNLIVAAYIPSYTANTIFFQPYDQNANIIVTGNTDCVQYSGWTTFPEYFAVDFTGNTKFEVRDLQIPSGFCVKMAIFSPAFSSGSTASFGGANISDEVTTGFSAESISVNFFSLKNDDKDLNIAQNLGDIGQLDYVKSWMNRYNLFIDANFKDKTINFEPYSNYFLPNDFAIDLTSKIDNNKFKPATSPVKLPKNVYFKYSNELNDALLSQDQNFGNLEIYSDNIYTENDKTISLLFSATKTRDFDLYTPGFAVSASTITLPSICNQDNYNNTEFSGISWSFAYQPRILKLTGEYAEQSGQTIYTNVGGYQTKILLSEFKNETPGKLSLDFDGNNGLYSNYYERFYNEIGDSYILDVKSTINPEDYQNLKSNVPVLLNGQSYILNSIKNFDASKNSITPLSLIKKFTN